MRSKTTEFIALVLALLTCTVHAAPKAAALPAANPSPNPTSAPTPAEILEAPREAQAVNKRWYNTGYGYGGYGSNPSWGGAQPSIVVVTQTLCYNCAQPVTYYTTTTWYGGGWYPTHHRHHHHYWGGATTTTVYTPVTQYVGSSAPPVPEAICSTITAKGPGLPVTTQGDCGTVVLVAGAERGSGVGLGIVGGLALTWLIVLMSKMFVVGGVLV